MNKCNKNLHGLHRKKYLQTGKNSESATIEKFPLRMSDGSMQKNFETGTIER